MDLRTRTSLFCGVLALAIAVSMLLRGRTSRPKLMFAAFAADIGLWYLAQWLYHFVLADVWARFTGLLAVLLPQFALHLFDAIVPAREKKSTLIRIASALMVPMVVLVLSPQHTHGWVRGAVFVYVFGLLAAGLWALAVRGQRSRSRATQRRVRFLVSIGAAAGLFTLADFLWYIDAPLPPVGAVLSIVFLSALAESMTRERLVDLYEILGQLLVSTALAFCLGGIFYVFVVLFGGFDTMYLGAILAAIVILVLFEPLRDKVESYIHKAFFRERVDLERAIQKARALLAHVLQVSEMLQVVISALEESRRATGAALYLRDPAGSDFELGLSLGATPPPRIDGAAARPLLDRLASRSWVAFEEVAYRVGEKNRDGWNREADADARLLAASEVLGPLKEGVCLGIHGEDGALVGMLIVVDDRVRDAFSPDEISTLATLALQIGVVIENSLQYRRLQERDRLAALGQMAAGLAHEVKNPLGAIKGAAQLLSEPAAGSALGEQEREFVGIILEEVERLDRVVGSALDYARPSKGNPGAVDVNSVVKRTLTVLGSDRDKHYQLQTQLAESIPLVRADAEQLRQVLMNLVKNAFQAMDGAGPVSITTRFREQEHATPHGPSGGWVEIAVRDQGPGIHPSVLKSLFVPFFTTKEKGTGLGLAISQRMVGEMGGRIEVSSQPGAGSTFTVVLPSVPESLGARASVPDEAGERPPVPGVGSGPLEEPA